MTSAGVDSGHTGAPEAVQDSTELLDALRMIDRLRDAARKVGSTIPLAQLLRAQTLIIGLHREGVWLSMGDVTRLLTALLATSRESQARLGSALGALSEPHKTVSRGTIAVGRSALWRRLLIAAVILLALGGLVYVAAYLVQSGTHTVVDTTTTIKTISNTALSREQLPRRIAERFMQQTLIPILYTMVPVIGAITWLLRPRPGAKSALKRMTDTGRRVESIALLPVDTAILRGATMRRTMSDLRRPTQISGDRIDTRATIRATIRSGAPTMRWRREARVHEYVLLCERGSGADHMVLLADAMADRLVGANVAFTRYDFGLGHAVVRHAGGRRSGPRSDALDAVCRRHAGARLIILGSGESLSRRFDGPGGASAFFELLDAFVTPLMLNVSPYERWGWREARLQDAGLAVFTADESGIAQAVAWLADSEANATPPRPRIEPGEDRLLALLYRDALRLASNVAPPEEDISRLVRRLRAYFMDVGGLGLLATIAAFPQIDPAITARIVLLATEKPIDTRLAGRLASLPWLRNGRMPDWLIIALLRALPVAERATVRGTLLLLLDDLRAAQKNETTNALARAARLDILTRSGVARQLLARAGLADGLLTGESIFVRFLEGTPPDELDQPDFRSPPPPSALRIAAAGALFVAGLIVAGLMPGVWRGLASTPGIEELKSNLPFGLLGFVPSLWHVQSVLLTQPKPGRQWLPLLSHTATYAILPFAFGTRDEAIWVMAACLTFTSFYIATSIRPITQIKLRDDVFPLARMRAGIILVAITSSAIGWFARERAELMFASALLIGSLSIFAVQRTLWEQPSAPPMIIEIFYRQVFLSVACMLTVMLAIEVINISGNLGVQPAKWMMSDNCGPIATILVPTYLVIAVRFEVRLLRPAILAAIGFVALAMTAPYNRDGTVSLEVGAIGIASAFALSKSRRILPSRPTFSLPLAWPRNSTKERQKK